MKTITSLLPAALVALALSDPSPVAVAQPPALPVRQMEALGRGVVAIHKGDGKVFVSWRLLGTDPDAVAFDVYRTSGEGKPVKLNDKPLAKVTWFLDEKADLTKATAYHVRPLLDGKEQP